MQDIEGNWFWLNSKTQEKDKHRLFRFLNISIMFFCVLIIVYVIGECTTSKHQQVTSKKEWLKQKRENSLDGFLTSCKRSDAPYCASQALQILFFLSLSLSCSALCTRYFVLPLCLRQGCSCRECGRFGRELRPRCVRWTRRHILHGTEG